jgi:hypothetical protein
MSIQKNILILGLLLLYGCSFQKVSDKIDSDADSSLPNKAITTEKTKENFWDKYQDIRIIHDSLFDSIGAFEYKVTYPILINKQCASKVNKLIKEIILTEKKKFKGSGKSEGSDLYSWQIIDIEDIYLTDDTFSVCLRISNQKAGAAHDFISYKSFNYDIKNDNLISIDNLKNKKRILELVNAKINIKFGFKDLKLTKIRDFSLNKDTLSINIQNYEIRDNSFGAPRIKISLNELK